MEFIEMADYRAPNPETEENLQKISDGKTRRVLVSDQGLLVDPLPDDIPSILNSPSHKLLAEINGVISPRGGKITVDRLLIAILDPNPQPSVPSATPDQIIASLYLGISFLKREIGS